MTPHLLLTAWAFAPARTSGVYRAIGIANAFAAAHWKVTVLCAPARLFQDNLVSDESLLKGVHPAVRVREVPLEHPELSTDLGEWGRLRARFPELWAKLRLRRDRRGFPEAWYGSWAPALRRAAVRVHRESPVTLALGTAAPAVDFVPGEELHRVAGVPYVMDYRDAWTIRTFTGKPPETLTPEESERERALIAGAHQVWFVNDPIRRWHEQKYPLQASAMRTVRNGFDAPAGAAGAEHVGVPLRRPAPTGLTFGYIGTINYGAFPLEAVVDGWALAAPDLPAGSRLVLRGHLGRSAEGSPQLRDALAKARRVGIRYEGPVARSEVFDVYRGFDALLLALPSGPGVTSGKVYEYAATGLPVVSVHTPETPVGEVLAESPHWHPTRSLSAPDVADAFRAAAADALRTTAGERAAAIAWGAQWERSRQLADAVGEITERLAGGPQ
ncbi:glycosyl transferase [Microbacterium sp. zg.Y909]|uniref:glycosyl transferase n=1 Tax=Microbacterium sp. zg.Y909 TaxID=2969413 RepID=UPI00214AA538|nr:glycosyl transferase [Microbacterium sp. zg.Y909]MCR2824034.1 glycosyl transferase [Microbacterium sp. zg.Y909]